DEARGILVRDLPDCKGQIVAATETAEKALANALMAGRNLVSRGIGGGPGVIQTPGRGAAPAPTSGIVGARPGSQIASPGSTAAATWDRQMPPKPVPQRDIDRGCEPVRPAADLTPAPPPARVAE